MPRPFLFLRRTAREARRAPRSLAKNVAMIVKNDQKFRDTHSPFTCRVERILVLREKFVRVSQAPPPPGRGVCARLFFVLKSFQLSEHASQGANPGLFYESRHKYPGLQVQLINLASRCYAAPGRPRCGALWPVLRLLRSLSGTEDGLSGARMSLSWLRGLPCRARERTPDEPLRPELVPGRVAKSVCFRTFRRLRAANDELDLKAGRGRDIYGGSHRTRRELTPGWRRLGDGNFPLVLFFCSVLGLR